MKAAFHRRLMELHAKCGFMQALSQVRARFMQARRGKLDKRCGRTYLTTLMLLWSWWSSMPNVQGISGVRFKPPLRS